MHIARVSGAGGCPGAGGAAVVAPAPPLLESVGLPLPPLLSQLVRECWQPLPFGLDDGSEPVEDWDEDDDEGPELEFVVVPSFDAPFCWFPSERSAFERSDRGLESAAVA